MSQVGPGLVDAVAGYDLNFLSMTGGPMVRTDPMHSHLQILLLCLHTVLSIIAQTTVRTLQCCFLLQRFMCL